MRPTERGQKVIYKYTKLPRTEISAERTLSTQHTDICNIVLLLQNVFSLVVNFTFIPMHLTQRRHKLIKFSTFSRQAQQWAERSLNDQPHRSIINQSCLEAVMKTQNKYRYLRMQRERNRGGFQQCTFVSITFAVVVVQAPCKMYSMKQWVCVCLCQCVYMGILV